MQYPLLVEGKNTLQTTILHQSGEKVSGSIEIVSKDSLDPQKVGAGVTYMRRYMLTCMFGLEEDDDDGNTAAGKDTKQTAKPTPQNTLTKTGNCSICGTPGIAGKYGAYCPNYKDDLHKSSPKPTFHEPIKHSTEMQAFSDDLDNIPVIY